MGKKKEWWEQVAGEQPAKAPAKKAMAQRLVEQAREKGTLPLRALGLKGVLCEVAKFPAAMELGIPIINERNGRRSQRLPMARFFNLAAFPLFEEMPRVFCSNVPNFVRSSAFVGLFIIAGTNQKFGPIIGRNGVTRFTDAAYAEFLESARPIGIVTPPDFVPPKP